MPRTAPSRNAAHSRTPTHTKSETTSPFEHLVTVSEAGKTTVQVVPYTVGAHPGTAGSFIILGFAEPGEIDVVYTETIGGSLSVDKPEEVRHYITAFDHLRAVALSPDDTTAMLNTALQGMPPR